MADGTPTRTSAGLRDILFDEIDALRKPKGNPQRALAVASLAKQIIKTVEAEIAFRTLVVGKGGPSAALELGSLQLGSPSAERPAVSAEADATAA